MCDRDIKGQKRWNQMEEHTEGIRCDRIHSLGSEELDQLEVLLVQRF